MAEQEKESCIKNARMFFSDLVRKTSHAKYYSGDFLNSITKYLARAEVGAEALDEEGKKSTQEMEAELQAAYKSCVIEEARDIYRRIKSGDVRAYIFSDLSQVMEKVDLGAEVLDETGKRSREEIEAELDQLSQTPAKYRDIKVHTR